MKKIVALLLILLLFVACSAEPVEVTRIVEQPVEVTRVVTETITEEGETVEVTRVVTETVIEEVVVLPMTIFSLWAIP